MGLAKTAFFVVVAAVGLQLVPLLIKPKIVYKINGKVEPGFENVQTVFKSNFDKNWDFEGAAFAACHKGRIVVDLWGGYADSTSNRLWREDTMTVVYSTTKAVSALCLAVLVDRGHLNYSDLVAKYWPEFSQNGKDKITVKMLASHQAGLAALNENLTIDDIKDWRKMSKAFEKQQPNWDLGTQTGYHVVTFGWLIDQIVRRVDPKKRSLGQFFREELAIPHNLDFYIGLPLELEHRVARLMLPSARDTYANMLSFADSIELMYRWFKMPSGSGTLFSRATQNPDMPTFGGVLFNNPELHSLEIGSANGIGTARALAQLFCLISSGNLLSKATLNQISVPVVVNQSDNLMPLSITSGWGFFHSENSKGQYIFGHPGYGGNNVKYDPNNGLALAYVRNGLATMTFEAFSFKALQDEVYLAIESLG